MSEDLRLEMEVSLLDDWFNEDGVDDLPENPWDILEGVNIQVGRVSPDIDEADPDAVAETEHDASLINRRLFGFGRIRDEMIDGLFEDDVLRKLALMIKTRIGEACHVNSSWEARRKAIQWIFCSTDDSSPENSMLSFRDAISPFGARHHVVQARLVYQLYRYCIPLRTPLPFAADGLPDVIENELYGAFGVANADNAVLLARTLWLWPGMRIDILQQETASGWSMDGVDFPSLLDAMTLAGYVGLASGFAFFICRNPTLRGNASTFNWSLAL